MSGDREVLVSVRREASPFDSDIKARQSTEGITLHQLKKDDSDATELHSEDAPTAAPENLNDRRPTPSMFQLHYLSNPICRGHCDNHLPI